MAQILLNQKNKEGVAFVPIEIFYIDIMNDGELEIRDTPDHLSDLFFSFCYKICWIC